MSLLDAVFQARAEKVDPVHPRDPVLAEMFGTANSVTGLRIDADSAMRVSAVAAVVRLLGETGGSLPLHLYERLPEGGKRRATTHPLYRILHAEPNRWQTRFEFIEMLIGHLALRGNFYAEKVIGGQGLAALLPLHPDRVRPFWVRKGGRAYLHQPDDGPERVLLQDEVLHVAGLGFDGLEGMNPIEYAREPIAVAAAAEQYAARFFANDARPGVILKHPNRLGDTALKHLRESWERRHAGVERSHRPAVLEEGMDVHELGVTQKDAEFMTLRKFQIADIARIFRVPPHMIGDLEHATFSNITEGTRIYLIHSVRPWLARIEQRFGRDLVTAPNRSRLYAEFAMEGILRGDTKTRFEAYSIARNWGWLNADEIREMENLNPLPDGKGQIYLQPVNMAEAGAPTPAEGGDGGSAGGRTTPRGEKLLPVLDKAAERVVLKEAKRARKEVLEKGRNAAEWAEQFYREHAGFLIETLGIAAAPARAYGRQRAAQFAAAAGSRGAVEALVAEIETLGAGDVINLVVQDAA